MLSWDDFNQEDTATTGVAVAPPPRPRRQSKHLKHPRQSSTHQSQAPR